MSEVNFTRLSALAAILALAATVLLVGCSSDGDPIKEIEGAVYDALADAVGDACEGVGGAGPEATELARRQAIEIAREVRQRGHHGPAPFPPPEGLDERTAAGPGPVLWIEVFCEGDRVPDLIREGLVRDWRD